MDFEGGFGAREIGKPDPVDANTLFMAASNTKGMTTLLLSRLADEKKIRWDQPATEIYPNFMASAEGYVGAHLYNPKLELGKAYDEAMQKLIFAPLGMRSTTFDMARALKSNHATPHGDDVEGTPRVASMAFNLKTAVAIPVDDPTSTAARA